MMMNLKSTYQTYTHNRRKRQKETERERKRERERERGIERMWGKIERRARYKFPICNDMQKRSTRSPMENLLVSCI